MNLRNTSLVEELGTKLELLRVKKGDILVVKVPSMSHESVSKLTEVLSRLVSASELKNKLDNVIIISHSVSIKTMSEAELNKAGLTKEKKIIIYSEGHQR